ncbi:speckle-type POZ protein-like [Parasteatoda tepidariorum]|uniref:speckle-type POZ protein-like n=1 Tax=Parasteatoda tepidariorum TaxID=114398 RepID=UPI001C720E39|nr:protein roadkill-like isoform X2 [Parasteatoda tepidariorum]
MELQHGLARSYFSTSQNGMVKFLWKIENFSLLQRDYPISSPQFGFKDSKYLWFLKLKVSYCHPNDFLILDLYSISNDVIHLNFTISVSQKISFYADSGSIIRFSKLNPVKLLPNIKLPRSLLYDFIIITCTIQVRGLEVESRTKTGTSIYPNLKSSESQSNQQSFVNEMDNNSGKADRKEQGANSLLKEKKVDESFLKIADSVVPQRTQSSGSENTPDDSPDLETLKQLSIDLKRMLTQTMNSDVTIRVEDIIIKSHKNILCARSQVFCRMFEHSTLEVANNEIEVTDIRASIMKKLINYLYCGEKGRLQYEDACELYYAADKYEILYLREACMKDLLCLLDVNNACPMLSLAYRHSDEVFKEQIMNFISKNFISIVKTESWIELTDKDTKLAALLMRYCAEALTK